MGIREKLSKNPTLVGGLAGVAIICAVTAIVMQARDSSSKAEAYYTVDDGKTVFTDSNLKVVPFVKDGKQAVRAHVFMCGGKRVVGYLSRYTADALTALEDVKAARAEHRAPKNLGAIMTLGTTGTEVKRPGPNNPWVRGTDLQRMVQIRTFRCPGEREAAKEIDP